jgi:pimeloyl-ACP methyl ester carboxylesterase
MAEISPALYRAGAGEPLVLIHGFTGSWRHWQPVLAGLVARYEVIAPTLAGHDGGPPFPSGTEMNFSSATDSFEGHLDELGVGTAHFVGNSLGGAIALELAKRGRARTVVALAPGGGWSDGDAEVQRIVRFFARTVRLTRSLERQLPRIMRRPGIRRLALRDMMRHGELVAPADAVAISRATARCAVAEAAIVFLRTNPTSSLSELGRISCPVLLASPQFDRILPAERHAPRFRREIPGVEVRTLTGCGHVPMWDDTALVVDTICEFVDRHAAGAAPGEDALTRTGEPSESGAPSGSSGGEDRSALEPA